MKTSLIVTVLNEEKTVSSLLESIIQQTLLPDEVIIVDGGSSDSTWNILKEYQVKNNIIHPLRRRGNRSVGRNAAIEFASHEVILITDAGCVLDREWVKEIVKPFEEKNAEIVAGYYKGTHSTHFQKSLIPYVLVMPDKVNSRNFLPATRSMAVKKSVWKELGEFDENYSHNEDYVFARKAKKLQKKIIFTPHAVALWYPRNTTREAFRMFYRFAYGDAEARIFRPKVLLLFVRYFFLAIFFIWAFFTNTSLLLLLPLFFVLYCLWTVNKNYSYVNEWQGFILLPYIQFIADLAVMKGTLKGVIKSGI